MPPGKRASRFASATGSPRRAITSAGPVGDDAQELDDVRTVVVR